MTELATYPVAHDRRSDRPADDESGARREVGRRHVEMHDESGSRCAPTVADRDGEILGPTHASLGREHWLRRKARRGPYGDARTRSPGRHGYASAAGSRASSRADDCSAGTCACSQQLHGCKDRSARFRHAQATPSTGAPATVGVDGFAGQTGPAFATPAESTVGSRSSRRHAEDTPKGSADCVVLVVAARSVLLASACRPSLIVPSPDDAHV